jgi:selenocysteine lyase/cysteine desulfurase/sulfur transfer protein SufE
MTYFYMHQNGNAQRASHRLARASTDMMEKTRLLATEFLGATSEREVVFTAGATEAFNIIAHGLSVFCKQGDEIGLSDSEHHANLLPWQRLAQQQQCELQFFSATKGVLNSEQFFSKKEPAVINERTRILALSGASNVFGRMLETSLLAAIKKRFPRIIIVRDASQMACHIPLKASYWQCDFVVCSAHKFYGPTGVGLLYAQEDYLQQMPPLHLGGEMVDRVELQSSNYTEGVQRFEAGTSSLAAIAGLQACLLFWQQQDRPAMQAYEQALVVYLHEQLATVCTPATGLQLITLPKNNVGIATLISTSHSFSLSDLAYWLDESDIAVRVGQHCAQTLWQSLAVTQGTDNGLRISLAAYNTCQDVDCLVAAINAFINVLPSTPLLAPSAVVPSLTSLAASVHIPLGDDLSHLQWQDLLGAPSWQKRFKVLLQWGSAIQPKRHIREPQNVVKGCESLVWVLHQKVDKKHYFLIDSDANLIKGLSALLLFWFDGKTSEEINAVNVVERYKELGLEKYLSASRMNGFLALLERVKTCV